jgi:hypothetical protein
VLPRVPLRYQRKDIQFQVLAARATDRFRSLMAEYVGLVGEEVHPTQSTAKPLPTLQCTHPSYSTSPLCAPQLAVKMVVEVG